MKGGAAIVDFDAMARAVHAAEDVLSAARSGTHPMTSARVGDCLYCLDQVIQWLDTIEASGELPSDAEATADLMIARFAPGDAKPSSPPLHEDRASDDWLRGLLEKYDAPKLGAKCALRYAPDADCFFRDEDPISLLAQVDDIVAIEFEPRTPWPTLDALDPFECNLVFAALTKCTEAEVVAALSDVAHQVQILRIADAPADVAVSTRLTPSARAVLRAQIDLLTETRASGAAGRLASAARTASNALRHVGMAEQARGLEGERDSVRLVTAIEAILQESSAQTSDVGVAPPAPEYGAANAACGYRTRGQIGGPDRRIADRKERDRTHRQAREGKR